MKKAIIAILVFGLFGSFAFAQNSQNEPIINSALEDLNDSVVPVRNEAGSETEGDVNLIDLEVGTSDTLTKTVNEVLKNSSNFSSTDWCRDASSFVGDLPVNVKQSLAWNKNSFNKVVEFVPENAELAVSYKNAQTAYADLNVAFDDMLSGLLADQAAGRFVAMARSASIEALTEFKSGNPDQDRLNGLAELAKKSVECASPENSDIAVEKLSVLFGTAMPTTDTVNTETVSYPITKISQKDVTTETVVVGIETVTDLETMKAYVLGLMSENGKIVSVEDKEDSVVVRYETSSKFLGFIKSKTNVKVTINDDLTVKVNYPFFSFLSSKSFKVNADEMSSALKQAFGVTEENASVKTSFLKGDFGSKAKVVETVASVLKASQNVSEVVVDDSAVEEAVVDELLPQEEVIDVEGSASGTVLEGAPVDAGVDVSVQ